MITYDLDKDDSLFEPLKLIVDGVELTIEDVTRKEFDRIADIMNSGEQLAEWAKIDVKLLAKVKMKKISVALKIIAKEFGGPEVSSFAPKKA